MTIETAEEFARILDVMFDHAHNYFPAMIAAIEARDRMNFEMGKTEGIKECLKVVVDFGIEKEKP